ncbi:MAG: ATP-binding protein, partial [Cellulomonas sp.]|nr:ATP-binding protein [Cellulomonas sp.]
LDNVTSNAVRHSPPDEPVLVLASASDREVEVRVIHRGPGVPEADRAAIFEPFRRLSDHHPDGVGLGLAVANGLATAVGADLSAEDTPGGGLTMVLRVPREEVNA